MGSENAPHELFGDKEKTAEVLTSIMSDLLGRTVDDVQRDTNLQTEVGLDSIHGVELYNRVARNYGVAASTEDLEAVETFGELVDLVSSSPSNTSQGRTPGQEGPV
ncbi:acyl carrier protein [Streptomyces sp. NPDC005876]|uniref:acyl carrier protein n=1 Tax=Streptomyces sp. NPDC005876 TaxID=3157076 RepID=UPI0033C3634D